MVANLSSGIDGTDYGLRMISFEISARRDEDGKFIE